MLNPRFKLRWCNEAEKDDLRRMLCQKVLELNSEETDGRVTPFQQQNESSEEPAAKRKKIECSKLFQFMCLPQALTLLKVKSIAI